MLSPFTADAIRSEIKFLRHQSESLDVAIQERLDEATRLDRRRIEAVERMEALQADLDAHVPSPATLAAKAAR